MAQNDIIVAKEGASGNLSEIALAPSDIGAQSLFTTTTYNITASGSFTLTAARAQIAIIENYSGAKTVTLPTANNQNGDVVVVRTNPSIGTLTVAGSAQGSETIPTTGSKRYVYDGTNWQRDLVYSHIHDTSDIASGTLLHERGGLEADVSAYNGLVKIASGSTSAVTVTSAGEALLDDADAAAQRTTLGAAASGSITSSGLTQATARILGRTTASTGAIEEIQIGSGLSLSAGELSSTVSAGIPATLLDAKGDLIVASAADTAARLPVGATNGHVLVVDSAESLGMKWAAVSGVVSGNVDNAILRADGTGGSTSQSSAITIDDAVVAFSITGVASTDIITATGHNFTANQAVRFPTLTGGSGLTAATTNYFVRDISGDTFKVSTTSGGAAVNFTTDITAGTVIAVQANVTIANISSETTSALVLTPKGANGAFIVGNKPDGTITGGNPRGNGAVDICFNNEVARDDATRVASGQASTIVGGSNQSASGLGSTVVGGRGNTASNSYSVACGGISNTASGDRAGAFAGQQNTASGGAAFVTGRFNTASQLGSFAFGERSVADRLYLLAHASGRIASDGDAQRIRAVLMVKTTNATATEMFISGATHRLTIPSGKVMSGIINCTGVKSDGSAVAHYIREFSIKNVGGTTTLVGTVNTIGTDNEDNASTDISVTANDGAVDALKIEVTGIASETWRWVASVDAVEVAYGT